MVCNFAPLSTALAAPVMQELQVVSGRQLQKRVVFLQGIVPSCLLFLSARIVHERSQWKITKDEDETQGRLQFVICNRLIILYWNLVKGARHRNLLSTGCKFFLSS